MEKKSFIVQVPDEPGALHKAARIAKQYQANIHRINYNRKIDVNTVFFDITASNENYQKIQHDLKELGYLQTSLKPVGFLKFNVYLPHRAGALFDFLNYLTSAKANIGFLDFDDETTSTPKLTVSLTLEESSRINSLLNQLKSQYPLEILEYDEEYSDLDDTIFYIVFAQKLREILGTAADEFLMKLLKDINHIVQELTRIGEEPRGVFDSVLLTGKTLKNSTGEAFYANVQRIHLSDDVELFCFQPPCGGNIFVLKNATEMFLIDTGYGIYHFDVQMMLQKYGLGDADKLKKIYITHADADHSGAAGYYDVNSFMHPGTWDIIKKANRAYGSVSETSILEGVYTKLINLFSDFNPPDDVTLISDKNYGKRNIFPIIDKFKIGGLEFEVLESLGGHLHGQIYLLCPEEGVLFPADSLINFQSLNTDRKKFNLLAKNLMTSVNVDGKLATRERESLIELVNELNKKLPGENRKCLICGGHGAVSVLSGDKLETYGEMEHYKP
jgi:glyoxylase-like metal-dependent hydrolase (beta-lactamase superfamily II)/ACT domain-containing protein